MSRLLSAEHAAHLARFGIQAGLLEEACVRSVADHEARELLAVNGSFRGIDLAGIVFPYISPTDGQRNGARVRLDYPTSDMKYVSEPGCRHIFFPPGMSEYLKDAAVTAVIVEAEKSALALRALCERADRPMLVMGIGGCYGWKRKVGNRPLPDGGTEPETGASPDFDFIAWAGRRVILAFDSNAATNANVRRARSALANELTKRGAVIVIAEIPAADGINGLDDLVAERGDGAVLAAFASASHFEPKAAQETITVRVGEVPNVVDKAEQALIPHAERLRLFQRGGELVRVVQLAERRTGGGLVRPCGTVLLDPMTAVALVETFERVARFERHTKSGEPRTIDCPLRLARTYLARRDWQVPVLAGIISAPVILEDGTVFTEPGFDEGSGLLLISSETWLPIDDEPTEEDVQRALEELGRPFAELPYCAAADRAVHLAAILTGLQRRTLTACPLSVFTAPTQRTGKSLAAESVAIIATGKPAAATGVSPRREELRKAITSSLREGLAIINLDNITDLLDSPDLARAITQPEYADRVLGESRMLRLPTNVLWTATGNNLTARSDLTSRTLMCRLDAGIERPEERTFVITDLKGYLIEHRREMVRAAPTILKAFFAAGRPKQDLKVWGGFDDWSRQIREPLVWAGAADPCETRATIAADDPEREEARAGLLALREAFPEGRTFTSRDVIEHCSAVGEDVLRAAMLNVAAHHRNPGAPDPRRLGSWFSKTRDRIVGGLRVVSAGKDHMAVRWKVERIDG